MLSRGWRPDFKEEEGYMFYQKGREGTKEIWMNEFADLLAGTVRAGLVQ